MEHHILYHVSHQQPMMGEWSVVQAALTEEQLDSMCGLVAQEPQIVFSPLSLSCDE